MGTGATALTTDQGDVEFGGADIDCLDDSVEGAYNEEVGIGGCERGNAEDVGI